MINPDKSKDMRMIILRYLEERDISMEQIEMNEWLSKLKTSDGQSDLGTIRRSLRDLKKEGYIIESDFAEIIDSCHLETMTEKVEACGYTQHEDRWNTDRFIKDLPNANRIPRICLGITLKGKSFLTNERMVYETHQLTKKQNRHFIIPLILGLLGTIYAIFDGILTQIRKDENQPQNINQEVFVNTIDSLNVEDTCYFSSDSLKIP